MVFGDGKNTRAIHRPDLFRRQWGEMIGLVLDDSGKNG